MRGNKAAKKTLENFAYEKIVSKPFFPHQYGETDTGLKRGNPLRLCPEMMEKLRRMWLNHGVSDEIAHKMESVHLYMATPWASL